MESRRFDGATTWYSIEDGWPILNAIEKLGCIYCSYANGLLAYIAEIAARTEQHFCPIKHAQHVVRPHSLYTHFLPYGDARAYRARSEPVARGYGELVARTK